MHYSNLVIVTKEAAEADLEAAVEAAMGPNEENGGFWDWYQIGGRWTGALDGYEPEKDPANLESEGKVKWPTQWVRHAGDVVPVVQLTEEQLSLFFRVCAKTDDYGSGIWGGKQYVPWDREHPFLTLPMLPLSWLKENFANDVAVVVDNHS